MEETSKQLPNFSVSIDLLGYPTSSTNEAEKNPQVVFRKFVQKSSSANFARKTFTGNKKSHQLVINNILR